MSVELDFIQSIRKDKETLYNLEKELANKLESIKDTETKWEMTLVLQRLETAQIKLSQVIHLILQGKA